MCYIPHIIFYLLSIPLKLLKYKKINSINLINEKYTNWSCLLTLVCVNYTYRKKLLVPITFLTYTPFW